MVGPESASANDELPPRLAFLRASWRAEDSSVNELVSILAECQVDLPPGPRQRKSFYVALFNERVAPKRSALRSRLIPLHGAGAGPAAPTSATTTTAPDSVKRKSRTVPAGSSTPGGPSMRPLVDFSSDEDADDGERDSSDDEPLVNSRQLKKRARTAGEDVIVISDEDKDRATGGIASAKSGVDKSGRNSDTAGSVASPAFVKAAMFSVKSGFGGDSNSAPSPASRPKSFVAPQKFDFADTSANPPSFSAADEISQASTSKRRATMVGIPSSSLDSPATSRTRSTAAARRKTMHFSEEGSLRRDVDEPPVHGAGRHVQRTDSPAAKFVDSPSKFVDFKKLATPVKNMPLNFNNIKHVDSPAPIVASGSPAVARLQQHVQNNHSNDAPSRAKQTDNRYDDRNEDITWDTILPKSTATPVRRSPRRKTDAGTPQSNQSQSSPASPHGIDSPSSTRSASNSRLPQNRRSAVGAKRATSTSRPRATSGRRGGAKADGGLVVAIGKVIISLAAIAYIAFICLFWDKVGYINVGVSAPHLVITGNKDLDHVLSRHLVRTCPNQATCFRKSILSCGGRDMVPRYPVITNFLATVVPGGVDSVSFLAPFGLLGGYCGLDVEGLKQIQRKEGQVERLARQLDDVVRTWVGRDQCGIEDPNPLATAEESSYSHMRLAERPDGRFVLGRVIGMPVVAARRELRQLVPKMADRAFDEFWDLLVLKISSASVEAGGSSRGSASQPDPSLKPTLSDSTPSDTSATSGTDGKYDIPLTMVLGSDGRHRLLLSSNPPISSIYCTIKRAMWETALAKWKELLAFGIFFFAALFFYAHRRARLRDNKVVTLLVDDILDSLYTESENHRLDPIRHPVSGLSIIQLRDHFLPVALPGSSKQQSLISSLRIPPPQHGQVHNDDNHNFHADIDIHGRTRWTMPDTFTRDRIWKDTSSHVKRHSCVRETVMEMKGEHHNVWQWIGSHTLSPKPRRSQSLGPTRASTATGGVVGAFTFDDDAAPILSASSSAQPMSVTATPEAVAYPALS